MKIELNIGSKECYINDKRMLPSKRKISVLCAIIPFILFWAGILSPVWTDNFIVYVFALAPYYFYSFYVSNDWIDGKNLYMTSEGLYASKIWRNCICVCSTCSISSIFLLTSVWGTLFAYPCLMLVLNAPMAAISIFYSCGADKFRYARPSPYFIA